MLGAFGNGNQRQSCRAALGLRLKLSTAEPPGDLWKGQDLEQSRLSAAELRRFLEGRRLYAFDPVSRAQVAQVTYAPGGICHARFTDGTKDSGAYGFKEATYWTQYTRFRAGQRSEFYLTWHGDQIAQAWHSDGRMAFLQSPLSELPRP